MTTAREDTTRRLTLSEIVRAQLGARNGGEHSSVKLTRNARGDTQIEVTVRTDEGDIRSVDDAAAKARALYDALCDEYPALDGEDRAADTRRRAAQASRRG